jgi:hypothetical protein
MGLALALALAVGGCGSRTYIYERPGATPARLDHDLTECRREAVRPDVFSITSAGRYDTDILNRCMERRGYRVTAE